MPRILHILSQIPAQTGSGIFFNNLVRQCQASGFEQSAVIGLPRALRGYPVVGIEPCNVREVLFETEELPYKIPGMSDVMPYDSTVFSSLDTGAFQQYLRAFRSAIREAVAQHKPQVILSNHLWVATAAVAEVLNDLDPDSRPRLYGVSHGTDLRQMQLSPRLKPYVYTHCQDVDGVFALNAYQLDAIQSLYGIPSEKIHLIGTGYDSKVFYPKQIDSKKISEKIELVYAGKLSESKGLVELLRSMELLDPNLFRLTLAGQGSGPEAERILEAISQSRGDIRYVGYLPQTKLAELFRDSDIFILPSYYEGLPLVVIEALASGTKVVVNELNGLRDWLGDAINDSGRITYVPMPKLKGLDTCDPDHAGAYVRNLAQALIRASETGNKEDLILQGYYKAIEERSWVNVFMRMERVFRL